MSLRVKRARSEKKQQPSISGLPTTPDGCSALQGSPPLTELPEEADVIFIESSSSSSPVSLGAVKNEGAALKKVEVKTAGGAGPDAGSSTPAESDKPPANATSAPTHSLLDLLADQALAREQPLSVYQEHLAAAVAKYKRSVHRWSFGVDTKSPPLPPPPPQSSPVNFPVCQVVLPQLQVGDFARHVDAAQVQIISDDSDTTIQ